MPYSTQTRRQEAGFGHAGTDDDPPRRKSYGQQSGEAQPLGGTTDPLAPKHIIPDIYDKPIPVYFRKSFQDLKHQMTKEVNPLTSAFVVDVHVQYINGDPKPKAYIVTDIHDVIQGSDPD